MSGVSFNRLTEQLILGDIAAFMHFKCPILIFTRQHMQASCYFVRRLGFNYGPWNNATHHIKGVVNCLSPVAETVLLKHADERHMK